MEFSYFPGCTLKTKARNLDATARECSRILGFELKEPEDWTCCGATFPLATDNIMALAPPARILADAAVSGMTFTTLCSVCYNVFKRTNRVIRDDEEKRQKINTFIERDYQGSLRILHYLEILKNEVGFKTISEKVEKKLEGLHAAAFYGCMLLRPHEEMEFDDHEQPTIFENYLRALGAEAVEFPFRNECCGSFQIVSSPEIATECAYRIIDSAVKNKAEAMVSTCPLCTYNIDSQQATISKKHRQFKPVPVFYFTQLLGLALGLEPEKLGFEQNSVDPRPLLEMKGFI